MIKEIGQALKSGVNKVYKWGVKRAPQLLTGGTILGLGATVYFTRKAAMTEAEKVKENPPKNWRDHIKLVARDYIPVAVGVVVTSGCAIGSDVISTKRLVGATVACETIDSAFKAYKNKVKETIGEKKAEKVEEEIRKDDVEHAKLTRPVNEPIYGRSTGPLWIECLTKHWFRADWTDIERAWEGVKSEALRTGATDYSLFLDYFDIPGGELSDMAVLTDAMVQAEGDNMCPKRMPAGYEENGNPMGYVYFDMNWFQLYQDYR